LSLELAIVGSGTGPVGDGSGLFIHGAKRWGRGKVSCRLSNSG
jgi:hypothetical protein